MFFCGPLVDRETAPVDFERVNFGRDFFGDLLPTPALVELPPVLVAAVASVASGPIFSVPEPEGSWKTVCSSLSFAFLGVGSRAGERGREAEVVGDWCEEEGRDAGLVVFGDLPVEGD